MITLKPLTKEDLVFLLEVRNNDSTRFYLEDDSIFNLKQCEEWFELLISPWYIIEINNIRVGYIRTNGDEIGCDIHPSYRRKGYARMAYKEYLKSIKYATLKVFNDNFVKELYKQLGFIVIGKIEMIRGREYLKMEYNG